MGKLRTPYNNKSKHKPSVRPSNGGGKPHYQKQRSNNSRYESSDENDAVVTGGRAYQKAVQSRDKYREMAREALVSGDRVLAENYHQHADHYCRVINAAHELDQERNKQRRQQQEAADQLAGEQPVNDDHATQEGEHDSYSNDGNDGNNGYVATEQSNHEPSDDAA